MRAKRLADDLVGVARLVKMLSSARDSRFIDAEADESKDVGISTRLTSELTTAGPIRSVVVTSNCGASDPGIKPALQTVSVFFTENYTAIRILGNGLHS